MKKSTKAVLLTALVFPGLGHYLLKRYASAAAIIIASSVLLYLLISAAIKRALVISDKILAGEVQPDLIEIARLASEASAGDSTSILGYATTALIVVWVVALLDVFRLTRIKN